MKVLHIYRTCYPETNGGIEQVIRYICSGSKQFGVESRIVSISNSNRKIKNIEGTEQFLYKKDFEISSNTISIEMFRYISSHIKWADIVHFHYPWPTGDLFTLLTKNKGVVVTYHSDIIKQRKLRIIYRPLEHYFLNRADKIIATSPQYAITSPNLNKFSNKVEIIPLSIEHANHTHAEGNWEDSDRLNYLDSGYFLFVGVLRYYKGIDYLIDAASSTDLKIVIAGSGPLEKELKKKVKVRGLTNVIFTGHVSEEEKTKLLYNSFAFIFPSCERSEAFGVSLLEAQAFKKPIISCDIGTGSSYVNINNETGLIIPPKCPKSITEAMEKLSKDQENAKRLGENGYQRLLENFTNERQSEKYYNLYKKVVERSNVKDCN